MTLDQAIDKLQSLSSQPWMGSFSYFLAAIKLGEEALKHTQHLRLDKFYSPLNRLPGETKD